jgi:DNA-binding transcriptional MerR regulator/methylmalonyl-CoA mutase cobalamin-binding subunit
MKTKPYYAIKYVSQRTGLTPHVIRAWEKRYDAVVPVRSPKNRRLYSEEDVQRLQMLKSATDAGHNISQVAGLTTKDLAGLVRREATAASPGTRLNNSAQFGSAADYFDVCLFAVRDLDAGKLERSLDRAAIDLTRASLLKDLIVPLFKEIGKLWHGGSLKIVNEHMATSVTRTFLLNMLRATEVSNTAPKIVVATTVGQWHDIGALTVALSAAENGWSPVYYGPNLPAEEIAAGVKHSGAKAVAISITHLLNQNALVVEMRKLRRYVGKNFNIFVGGRVVGNQTRLLEGIGATFIATLDEFSEHLFGLLQLDVTQK